jgi:hypothetical protein
MNRNKNPRSGQLFGDLHLPVPIHIPLQQGPKFAELPPRQIVRASQKADIAAPSSKKA